MKIVYIRGTRELCATDKDVYLKFVRSKVIQSFFKPYCRLRKSPTERMSAGELQRHISLGSVTGTNL